MRYEAWFWGLGLILYWIFSALGYMPMTPEILVAVPAGLFAVGAGTICLGRPGVRTRQRILACIFAAFTALSAFFHLPLRVGFFISKAGLENAIFQSKPGKTSTNIRAGIHNIIQIEPHLSGQTTLWVHHWNDFRAGFVNGGHQHTDCTCKIIWLNEDWSFMMSRSETSSDQRPLPKP
jgi:hypothetical protein